MPQENRCNNCGSSPKKLFACGQCLQVSFCGKDCQVAFWKAGHQKQCARLAVGPFDAALAELQGPTNAICVMSNTAMEILMARYQELRKCETRLRLPPPFTKELLKQLAMPAPGALKQYGMLGEAVRWMAVAMLTAVELAEWRASQHKTVVALQGIDVACLTRLLDSLPEAPLDHISYDAAGLALGTAAFARGAVLMHASDKSEAARTLVRVGLKMADVLLAESERDDGWKICWCHVISGCSGRIAMFWLFAPDEFKELTVDAIAMIDKMAESLQGSRDADLIQMADNARMVLCDHLVHARQYMTTLPRLYDGLHHATPHGESSWCDPRLSRGRTALPPSAPGSGAAHVPGEALRDRSW